jgi:hypothetical protein
MKSLRALAGDVVMVGSLAAGLAVGCGATGSSGFQGDAGADVGAGGKADARPKKEATTSGGCEVATFRDCTCPLGGSGMETCGDGGTWSPCACTTPIPDASRSDAPPVCGDGVCNGTETCTTCPADCGTCAACNFAPSCTGASSVPAAPTALASFNNDGQSVYSSGVTLGADGGLPSDGDGGASTCSDPLLKMRISEIQIHKNGASGGVEMFCMVEADDGQSSELMVTPDYMNLADNNPALILTPGAGTFWGEAVNGVKLSQFNITVTYQCFMVLQPSAFQNALNAIANTAGSLASIPGNPYGWAFGVGGAAAAAAAAATAAGSGASVLLSVQQTIDSSSLLQLTNGYTWVVEQTGSTKLDGDCDVFESCNWDWELDVEAWGCAAPKGQTPMPPPMAM